MDASKSHFMGLVWASILIVLFTLAATVMIVTWSPLIPEAVAVDMSSDAVPMIATASAEKDFAPYLVLHETESWHYTAALHRSTMIADCSK